MAVHSMVVVLALALGSVPSLGGAPSSPNAQASPPQEMPFTVEGKITQLSSNTFTVNSGENIIFRVRYDDKTEIKREDGSAGSAKDLHVGLTVRVEGSLSESGVITAGQIEIRQKSSGRKPAQGPQP